MSDIYLGINTSVKKCSKCHIQQPITHFNTHPTARDGYLSKCKRCLSKERKAYRRRPEVIQKEKRRNRMRVMRGDFRGKFQQKTLRQNG